MSTGCEHNPAEACLRCHIYRLQFEIAAVKVCHQCRQTLSVRSFPGYAAPVCRYCLRRAQVSGAAHAA